MIVINFSHPLTQAQLSQIEALAGQPVAAVRYHPAQVDLDQPLIQQARALVDQVGLTAEQWQSEPLLINPPALSVLAVLLLAELHGRMGHFPAVLRLKPVAGPLTTYEAAELINLQAVRDAARGTRPG